MDDGDNPINTSMHRIEMEKPHDISFDKDKTLMRTQLTKGSGVDCREGSIATIHFSVHHQVEGEGELTVFDSKKQHPAGIRFAVGLTMHAEVLHRAVLNVQAQRAPQPWSHTAVRLTAPRAARSRASCATSS